MTRSSRWRNRRDARSGCVSPPVQGLGSRGYMVLIKEANEYG